MYASNTSGAAIPNNPTQSHTQNTPSVDEMVYHILTGARDVNDSVCRLHTQSKLFSSNLDSRENSKETKKNSSKSQNIPIPEQDNQEQFFHFSTD